MCAWKSIYVEITFKKSQIQINITSHILIELKPLHNLLARHFS